MISGDRCMKILTRQQIREEENRAVMRAGRTYEELMYTAGTSAAQVIAERYNLIGKKVNVVCGSGNNGGDGIVIAYALSSVGADVSLSYPLGKSVTDTASHFADYVKDLAQYNEVVKDSDFIVDALFGIGLDREPQGIARQAINDMNSSNALKIAVDIPSGVFSDGELCNIAVKADMTVTFIAFKPCFFLPTCSEYCGEVLLCDLGIEPEVYSYMTVEPTRPVKRRKNSHKGSFGTALVFCGSYGMCGAEILAVKAALRSGAGVVKALACDKNYSALCASVPEAVLLPVSTMPSGAPEVYDRTILSAVSGSDALLIGCGLGRNDDAVKFVKRVIEVSDIPTVIDADGINAVSGDINIIRTAKAPLVLTPHPAEMARLCKTTVSEIEKNRIRFARSFAREFHCVLVLKGANTIVASSNGELYFNTNGNPGMATAGSGDVLSGIILANLAAGMSPLESALAGVYTHSAAGDSAAKRMNEKSILAGDIIEELCRIRF